jgi:hypothetical protein
VLFPWLYGSADGHGHGDAPQVTPAVLHQLVDAVCEAGRAAGSVVLVTVPVTRRGPHPRAADRVRTLAETFTAHGLPVRAGGDVTDQATASSLVTRACGTRYTRRAVDLPDLLTAAAADALHADRVVLADGLAPGQHLRGRSLLAPLSRLHPADPFAPPPPGAKRPPAGTDARWATALTLGLTGHADPLNGVDSYPTAVRERLNPLWRHLTRLGLTGHHGPALAAGPPHLHADPGHRRGEPVTVPLFGAPVPAARTRALVAAAALAGPPYLMVDDLTPRFSYPHYDPDRARAHYLRLASDHAGRVRFVTDLPGLARRVDHALATVTHADLRAAAGPRADRLRGALTGYDAVHLAVMALCCTGQAPSTLAVTSANARAARLLARLGAPRRLITVTTDGNPADLTVPARWLTGEHP